MRIRSFHGVIIAISALIFICSACQDSAEDNLDGMLPAALAEAEKQDKADDAASTGTDPLIQWTAAPTDVVRLPAEFESPSKLLISWSTSSDKVAPFFASLIAVAVTEVDEVTVFVYPLSAATKLQAALSETGADLNKVKFVEAKTNSVWIRDFGPLVVKTKSAGARIIDLRYGSFERPDDETLPSRLAADWDMPVSRPKLNQEGGNFLTDGAGTCISTEAALSRNAGRSYTAKDLQSIYLANFGCPNTLILPQLKGEPTNHVDMYVTITGVKTAIVGQYSEADDAANAKITDQGAQILAQAGFKVIRIPMPSNTDGKFRSYTNGLALGRKVLVPVYKEDKRYEKEALKVFQTAYPDRTIFPVDSSEIIRLNGAIHCVTMTING